MTKRLEARVGVERLVVDAIIEVDPPRAEAALKLKSESPSAKVYANTVILPDVKSFAEKVKNGNLTAPTYVTLIVSPWPNHNDCNLTHRAIFVATPPAFRGGLKSPRDLELQLIEHFPSTPIFLEKPVATGAPWEESIGEAYEVAKRLKAEHKGIISIGYVLRYLKASQIIKKIIEENNLHV